MKTWLSWPVGLGTLVVPEREEGAFDRVSGSTSTDLRYGWGGGFPKNAMTRTQRNGVAEAARFLRTEIEGELKGVD